MPQRSVIQDPFKFAAEGRRLTGSVPLAELGRLADVLIERDGDVVYEVSGDIGADRKPRLVVSASSMLVLRCQRCLEPMRLPLRVQSVLQLVRPGQAIPDEELEIEEFDAIEATPDMDALAIVEDEIVLAVPIAPRHEDCDVPRPSDGAEKESPFAALAKLRKSGDAD